MAPTAFSNTLHVLLYISLLFRTATPAPVTLSRDSPLPRNDLQTRAVFSVLGVASLGDPSVHPRLEVRQLEKNADQWNIYLLGLKRFQETVKDDRLSYSQIAGIHGRPYASWDGVNQGPGGSGGGYCPHGANVFPTWHRPFLVLFEQLLYLNVRQVVSEFLPGPLKDKYSAALTTFRMPYWDWAAVPPTNEGPMPWSVQKPTVDVVLPNSTTSSIPNPLFAYRFPSGSDLGDAPFSTWPTTLRDPSSFERNAASRNDLVALELDKNRKNLQSRVYNVLAMQHDYANVSNDLQPGDNFESVHDTIHNTVGSDGHMSFLALAAFDPIFWLHHTNVDRIFAIWQALNPNSYVTPMSNPYATFTEPANSVADVNTPLTPFHRDDSGKIWTSDGVRSISTFGYTYPELVGFNGSDPSSLILKVNKLYGPDAGHQKRAPLDLRAVAGAPNFSGQRQYVTNIKVKKFSGIGSFNIYVFLGGEPGIDAKEWVKKPSFVGVTGMLSQPMQPDNPKADIEAHGAVPLTAALEQKVRGGELDSMEEKTVADYLNQNLKWRIATMKGDLIPVEQTPGFQISVLWVPIKPAESASEFPESVGDFQVLVVATDGLPGGFAEGNTVSSGGY